MKKTLTFDNFPDDEFDFKCANKGVDMYMTLLDIDDLLRSLLKYGSHGEINTKEEKLDDHTLEFIRKVILNIRNEREVNFEE